MQRLNSQFPSIVSRILFPVTEHPAILPNIQHFKR